MRNIIMLFNYKSRHPHYFHYLRYTENNLLAIYRIVKVKYREYGRLTDNSTLPVNMLYLICWLNVHKQDGCKEQKLMNTLVLRILSL